MDFSKPSKDCYLSVDKEGNELKEGDILQSILYPLHGTDKRKITYNPIEKREGRLIIPHAGSFLLHDFVRSHCVIVGRTLALVKESYKEGFKDGRKDFEDEIRQEYEDLYGLGDIH